MTITFLLAGPSTWKTCSLGEGWLTDMEGTVAEAALRHDRSAKLPAHNWADQRRGRNADTTMNTTLTLFMQPGVPAYGMALPTFSVGLSSYTSETVSWLF